jgi:hypothetical protein
MVSNVSTVVMEAIGVTSTVAENSNKINSKLYNSNNSNSDFKGGSHPDLDDFK